ncbi:MAG: DUF2608 domain-containing protein [Gammaproteobacteria bacterium]|nr:DUF2608 domain-containing protein [Gammaproteobacteria bacterium]
MIKKIVLLFVVLLISPAMVFASQQLETKSFKDVVAMAQKLGQKYGNNNVLLVFDVDNTLLTSNQVFGSMRWWLWQVGLLREHPKSSQLVAHSMLGLMHIQNVFFLMGHLHPTSKDVPHIVNKLQKDNFRAIVLSARNPQWYDVTQRELVANNMYFTAKALPLKHASDGIFFIQDKKMRRLVSYADGIMLTNGFNKGEVLKALLKKTQVKLRAIIFVDNTPRNTVDVFNAFKNSDIDVVTFRYGREDAKVKGFAKKDEVQATRQWRLLQTSMKRIFSPPAY